MYKTYTYKIKERDSIRQDFEKCLGACRFIYNLGKEVKSYTYLAFGRNVSKYDLYKQLTQLKKEEEWLREVPNDTLRWSLDKLEDSYNRFFRGAGFPKWAVKGKWKTVGFKTVKITNKGFKLPKLGEIKVFNYKRKPNGKLKTASITREVDGLYLNVTFKLNKDEQPKYEKQGEVAIDMGLKHFLVTSDGSYFENPKILSKNLRQLRVEQRSLSRKKFLSNNWYKQKEVVQKLHLKIKRSRKDYSHKASTKLSNKYSLIYREDLDIKKMIKDKKLSSQISDVSWSMFFEMLEYKADQVVKVDPKYTSQTCSECGYVSKENRKTQANFKCVNCGFEMNADEQACLNILKRGHSLLSDNVAQ